MNSGNYRFELGDGVDLDAAERTLHLSILAVEGLYGPAWVRIDVGYQRDPAGRAIVVDATTEVGASVVRIFASFLTREFGEDAYVVRRLAVLAPSAEETAAS